MSVRAEQTSELYATRILTQPIFNRIQLAVRRVGRDDETFLAAIGDHTLDNVSRSLPTDEGREQQNASRKRDGSPTEDRGANEIRKFHEEQTQRLGHCESLQSNLLQRLALQTRTAERRFRKFRVIGLGLPLNSVLESKLNHDLSQQSRCQAGEASGCPPDGVAGKTWDAGSDSEFSLPPDRIPAA